MNKEELLRRLEERLARGEISEKTYLEIKARYDAMPEVPPPPPEPAEPQEPQQPPTFPRGLDLEGVIEQSIASAMREVAHHLRATLGSKEFEQRMEEAGRRVEEAFGKFGSRVEAGGRRIVIRGSGVVSGGSVDEFKSAGSGKVSGDLRANVVHISGACKIEGRCECREFHASGSTEVASDLKARELKSAGSLEVGGNVDAEEVHVAGRLGVRGFVRAREFSAEGRLTAGERLEAEEVNIRLLGTSRVPVIKGQEITVRRSGKDGELEADTIEGREVYLEGTRAKLVRGQEVRIGPFCAIDAVEARELEVHETATVKERRPLSSERPGHPGHAEHAGHP